MHAFVVADYAVITGERSQLHHLPLLLHRNAAGAKELEDLTPFAVKTPALSSCVERVDCGV
jgi:hypothetical protein